MQEAQLAQDTSLQESQPQARNILGRLAGQLQDHQDPALAAQGQLQPGRAVAQQPGWQSHRSPADKQGGEKLLPPNRLSSFSRPALHEGCAAGRLLGLLQG